MISWWGWGQSWACCSHASEATSPLKWPLGSPPLPPLRWAVGRGGLSSATSLQSPGVAPTHCPGFSAERQGEETCPAAGILAELSVSTDSRKSLVVWKPMWLHPFYWPSTSSVGVRERENKTQKIKQVLCSVSSSVFFILPGKNCSYWTFSFNQGRKLQGRNSHHLTAWTFFPPAICIESLAHPKHI